MPLTLFTGGRVLHPGAHELAEGDDILVEDDRIREIGPGLKASSARRIELNGKTIMPGLIDAHVHAVAWLINTAANAAAPASLVALRAHRTLSDMLMRGFTTVRDVGGADVGIKMAVEEGLVPGPRFIQCGNALGQTGGHIDIRSRNARPSTDPIGFGALGRVCDGVDEVRRCVREELKRGAEFVKLMANGGVSTPHDSLRSLQFSRDEILVAVEEAENFGTYVSAHVYSDKAILRAVECGVHSLEHCNLISPTTARLAAEKGAIACPTLTVFEALMREGPKIGLSASALAKADEVRRAGLESLDIMRQAGLAMAFGTDLPGQLNAGYQSMEFALRSEVLSPREIIASATVTSARLCGMEGRIGVIEPDALADLLVIDGDPLRDIGVLQEEGRHMPLIMRNGTIFKNTLAT